jgi:hypothetical protein
MAELLGRGDGAPRLRALAAELERQIENRAALRDAAETSRRHRAAMLAEMKDVCDQIRAELSRARRLLQPMRFSGDDLREESRLCREEAAVSGRTEMGRALASRAAELAMFGEHVDRRSRGR